MKKITEMSHDEIIQLTEDDVETLIDFACAEEGIPLMEDLPPEPKKQELKKEINSYEVAGIRFSERSAAEKVRSCIESVKTYVQRVNYHTPSMRDFKIDETVHYTEEEQAQREHFDAVYNQHMKEWNILESRWKEIRERRFKKALPIQDTYQDALSKQRIVVMLQSQLRSYYTLAEENPEIAVKFLRKAYPEALEKVEDIFSPESYVKEL